MTIVLLPLVALGDGRRVGGRRAPSQRVVGRAGCLRVRPRVVAGIDGSDDRKRRRGRPRRRQPHRSERVRRVAQCRRTGTTHRRGWRLRHSRPAGRRIERRGRPARGSRRLLDRGQRALCGNAKRARGGAGLPFRCRQTTTGGRRFLFEFRAQLAAGPDCRRVPCRARRDRGRERRAAGVGAAGVRSDRR